MIVNKDFKANIEILNLYPPLIFLFESIYSFYLLKVFIFCHLISFLQKIKVHFHLSLLFI